MTRSGLKKWMLASLGLTALVFGTSRVALADWKIVKKEMPTPPSSVHVTAPPASDSVHVKAPPASDSVHVKAPPAPDIKPTPQPNNDGPPKGTPKGNGPSKGKPDGNGKGNHPDGFGKHPWFDPGHGKGNFIPIPVPVPIYGNGGWSESYTGGGYVEAAVPPAPPAPSAPTMPLILTNPAKNGVAMPFLLNGQTMELAAGERYQLPTDRAWEIKFDHGQGFGIARYSLTGGEHRFTHTDHGWELYNYAAEGLE
jgi:hypothetical protein